MTARCGPPNRPTRAAGLAVLFAAALLAAGQPPEEQEDPAGGKKKAVVVPDADSNRPDLRLAELADAVTRLDAAAKARPLTDAEKGRRELFARFAVPFDLLTEAKEKAEPVPVRPLPYRWPAGYPKDTQFPVAEVGGPARTVKVADVREVQHFEDLARAAADAWAKENPDADGLDAAERVLAAAQRFHEFALKQRAGPADGTIRRGDGWGAVGQGLVERLRAVRLRQLEVATADGARRAPAVWALEDVIGPHGCQVLSDADRARVHAAATKLLTAYPANAAVRAAVAQARVAEAGVLLRSPSFPDHLLARTLTDEAEANLGAASDAVRLLRKQLAERADAYRREAERLNQPKTRAEARTAVEQAWALDPARAGVKELRAQLGGALYVGVRDWPVLMSPATARLDSEKYAVELMFEGLLEEVPDPAGARYRPASAAAWPVVTPGGRDCLVRVLPPGPADPDGFDARDAAGTLRLLRASPGSWSAAAVPWFDDRPEPPGGPGLRLGFRVGHPDPRALLTTKILPARRLSRLNRPADDPDFGTRPFGTGPYRLYGLAGKATARELVFTANPQYAAGQGDRTGLPQIDEVRLVDLATVPDVAGRIKDGKLDVLPDPTPDDLRRILDPKAGVAGQVRVVTAQVNRRVYVLALNHRQGPFQSVAVRRAVSQAIDREQILESDGVQRLLPPPAERRFTAPMTGPFPPGSWATRRPGSRLVLPSEAARGLREYLRVEANRAKWSLLCAEPPRRADADPLTPCEQIKAQIEGLFGDPKERRPDVTIERVPAAELFRRVAAGDYDMAYLPVDYPDDWYPLALAAMLDPEATGPTGRNVFQYRTPGTRPAAEDVELAQLLEELRASADFAGKLAPKALEVHDAFNQCVPFVPLWQLDRRVVVHKRVKVFVDDGDEADPAVLNPAVLFHNVARWRLE